MPGDLWLAKPSLHAARPADSLPQALEASLRVADLVICQTGCLGHGDYWRVQDHCRRSGRLCMLADQPDRVHIVRTESLAGSFEDGPEGGLEDGPTAQR